MEMKSMVNSNIMRITVVLGLAFVIFSLLPKNLRSKIVDPLTSDNIKATNNPVPSVKHAPASIPAAEEPKKEEDVAVQKPDEMLKASDLLPLPAEEDKSAFSWASVAKTDGKYKDRRFMVGINTQGSSLKNANRQLRADPPIKQAQVSPWMQSTIEPDMTRKTLC